MYRIVLVIGLRDSKRQTKRVARHDLTGAITVHKVLDAETTEVIHPSNASRLTGQANDELLPDESVFFWDLPFPRIFKELRKKFKSSVVNTNADIYIHIGTMSKDCISECIPREVYMRTKDSELVKYYLNKIKACPELSFTQEF